MQCDGPVPAVLQPLRHLLLALIFEWRIAPHGLHAEHERGGIDAESSARTGALLQQNRGPGGKYYLFVPAPGGRAPEERPIRQHGRYPLRDLRRTRWSAAGHFAGIAERFTPPDASQAEISRNVICDKGWEVLPFASGR